MIDSGIAHIIDDDTAIRQSLGFLLSSDGIPVRLYESASAFLSVMTNTTSGCIITDIRMPKIDGIEFLRILKARGCRLPVIVMTGHADIAIAVEAMKLGAADFVEKPFEDREFIAIVRSALSVAELSVQPVDENVSEIGSRIAQLSPRERQVLEGLITGQANKVIAQKLGISPRTVEIYRANVMTKMQAQNLSHLVRMSLLKHPLYRT